MVDGISSVVESCETMIKHSKNAPLRFLHEPGKIKPVSKEADVKKVITMYPKAFTSVN